MFGGQSEMLDQLIVFAGRPIVVVDTHHYQFVQSGRILQPTFKNCTGDNVTKYGLLLLGYGQYPPATTNRH